MFNKRKGNKYLVGQVDPRFIAKTWGLLDVSQLQDISFHSSLENAKYKAKYMAGSLKKDYLVLSIHSEYSTETIVTEKQHKIN